MTLLALALAACGTAPATAQAAPIPIVIADDTITAEGRLEPVQYAKIAFTTSGVVSEVLVQEGQSVKQGESLIRLGNESDTNFAAAQLELVSAQQALDDLLNSRETDLAQAEQNLANAKQAVEDAQKDVTKLDYRRASDDLLDQTQAEIDLANEQVSYAEDAYKLVKNRPEGDPLRAQALLDLTNARLNRDRKQATLDWYLGKPSELVPAKYRAALSVALAQEAAAQREYDLLKDGPDVKTKSFAERVLGTTSLVALSAAAMIGAQQPAAAQTGIYGGGSTLSSLALRQIFDCYAGSTLANDGQAFSPSFSTATPSPNLLPTSCTLGSTSVEGLFAAVGSGNGQRAYIADDARQLFRGSPDSAPAVVRKPSAKPPFRDTANAAFKSYPYPRLDFAASDAPLASSISSLTTISFSNFVPSTNWQNRGRLS